MDNSFPTTPFDWYNFIAQESNSNSLIQFVLKFDSHMDPLVLKKALECCMAEDPVLGCIFSKGEGAPVWKVAGGNIPLFLNKVHHEPLDSEVDAFLAKKIDVTRELPVKVALFFGSEVDVLVVKLHHALCDAAGALQFVRLLARNYSIAERDAQFYPQPLPPKRGIGGIYEFFRVTDKKIRFDSSLLPMITSTWGAPDGGNAGRHEFSYRVKHMQSEDLKRLRYFAERNDSSVNALLTMAYHCALAQILQPEDAFKEVQFTINLRNYSKGANTICNLSNTFSVKLPVLGTFPFMAREAKMAIDRAIEPEKVLQSVLACDLMFSDYDNLEKSYLSEWAEIKKSGLCTPMISNVGKLDTEPICFGALVPSNMYVISPAFEGPAVMLSVSTYGDVITLCTAYYKPSVTDVFVNALINKMGYIIQCLS